jgi:hypothetical protein
MLCLALDVAVSMVSDSVHWQDAFGYGRWQKDLFASIALLVIAILVRLGFSFFFFLAIVTTAHFRLGRYSELFTDFGGAMIVMLISFVITIGLRVVRIVMAARKDATTHTNIFWEPDRIMGVPYSSIWCLHLLLTAFYYIKSISALRRLANSDYHTHPDMQRRRQPSGLARSVSYRSACASA